MRFEAKHSYFKHIAVTLVNYKNISKTLAARHQRYLCYNLVNTHTYASFNKDNAIQVGNCTKYYYVHIQGLHSFLFTYMCTYIHRWSSEFRIRRAQSLERNITANCKISSQVCLNVLFSIPMATGWLSLGDMYDNLQDITPWGTYIYCYMRIYIAIYVRWETCYAKWISLPHNDLTQKPWLWERN